MANRELTIVNKLGLHARAAAKLVSLASGFESEITIRRGEQEVNAKSIMGVMMLAATGIDENVAGLIGSPLPVRVGSSPGSFTHPGASRGAGPRSAPAP